MQIRNHIVYYLLKNPEIVTESAIKDYQKWNGEAHENTLEFVRKLASKDGNKSFYITQSTIDKIPLLKANINDWSVLDNLPDCKYTFILPNDRFLRFIIEERDFLFYYVHRVKKGDIKASYYFYSLCENTCEGDFQPSKEFVFKLLCFFFLSKNTEIVVNAGKSYGTRKQIGGLSNDSDEPIIIVNSNWNVTSVRLQGFNVSGHFRLQPCGVQFSETKMIFIEPFKKHGYVRRATKELLSEV